MGRDGRAGRHRHLSSSTNFPPSSPTSGTLASAIGPAPVALRRSTHRRCTGTRRDRTGAHSHRLLVVVVAVVVVIVVVVVVVVVGAVVVLVVVVVALDAPAAAVVRPARP